MSNQTAIEYKQVIKHCRNVFEKKNHDYGPSWRIMRVSSIVDQIYIKAVRIRTIEEKGSQKIDEGVESEFMGIINYCLMALIQLEPGINDNGDDIANLLSRYDREVEETFRLMQEKNHDYGEIWRDMLVSTFTDMLLMRVHRIRQIQELEGKTIASEGIDSNLRDMINYSVFALIRLEQTKK